MDLTPRTILDKLRKRISSLQEQDHPQIPEAGKSNMDLVAALHLPMFTSECKRFQHLKRWHTMFPKFKVFSSIVNLGVS